jgi:hypothetical protein
VRRICCRWYVMFPLLLCLLLFTTPAFQSPLVVFRAQPSHSFSSRSSSFWPWPGHTPFHHTNLNIFVLPTPWSTFYFFPFAGKMCQATNCLVHLVVDLVVLCLEAYPLVSRMGFAATQLSWNHSPLTWHLSSWCRAELKVDLILDHATLSLSSPIDCILNGLYLKHKSSRQWRSPERTHLHWTFEVLVVVASW